MFKDYSVWSFSNLFIKGSNRNKLKDVLYFAVFSGFSVFTVNIFQSSLSGIFLTQLILFLLLFIKAYDIYNAVFAVLVSSFLEISIHILNFPQNNILFIYKNLMFRAIIFFGLEYIIKNFYKRILNYKFKVYKIILLLFLLYVYWLINMSFNMHNLFNVFGIVLLNILILCFYNEILYLKNKEKEAGDYKYQLRTMRCEIYRTLCIKHNLKLYIYNIKRMLSRKEYSALERYLSRLESSIKKQSYAFSKNEQVKKMIKHSCYGKNIDSDIWLSEEIDIYQYGLNIFIDNILNIIYKYADFDYIPYLKIEERFALIFIKMNFNYNKKYADRFCSNMRKLEEEIKSENNYSVFKLHDNNAELDIILYKNNISNLY